MNNNFKILIAPQFGIGDALLATPAIKILKENLKNCEITYFAFNKAIYEIFKNNRDIDKVLFFSLLSKGKFESFFYFLKNFLFKFDVCINFYPSNRTEYNLFSFFTFSKLRLGHRYLNSDFSQLNWLKNRTILEKENLHCVEENVRVLKFLNIKVDFKNIPGLQIYFENKEIENAKNILSQLKAKGPLVGIHPGSSVFKNQYLRRWDKEKFLMLIKYLVKKDCRVVVFGGPDDKKLIEFFKSKLALRNILYATNLSIKQVAALIKNLKIFISNDSGLMHIAAACNVPVVAIFGPTNPAWVRPWKVKHEIVRANIDCPPCFVYSPKPLKCVKDRDFECLKEISVEMVIEKVEKLL